MSTLVFSRAQWDKTTFLVQKLYSQFAAMSVISNELIVLDLMTWNVLDIYCSVFAWFTTMHSGTKVQVFVQKVPKSVCYYESC